ncbi:hypothetical protein F4678DRAFT_474138 [Xylaria arbuscula]|nr:hypothetical protein F4678DRAFT_474138 [Xylaria arbuscula]
MTGPRPSDSVRAIIEGAVPSIKVETVSIIPTKRLLRVFKVKLTDERTLLLNLLPPSSRLLRHEKRVVQSEAAVVEWLSQDACRQQNKGVRCLDEKSFGRTAQGASSMKKQAASGASSSAKSQLLSYLPTLVKHSSTSTETESPFSLFEPKPGDPISSLGNNLTPRQRRSINFQKGCLIRRIADVTSPNGRFGQAATVLEQPQAADPSQTAIREAKIDVDDADGWRRTFHLLLEGILRDGEDRAVTISYELVRAMFHKFGHLLDAVTIPRLVVCDADEDDVVLVSRLEKAHYKREQQDPGVNKRSPKAKIEPDDSTSGFQQRFDEDDDTAFEITGLQYWSNCIFGDPLFATVFSHTTPEFERGFRQPHEDSEMEKRVESHKIKKEEEEEEEEEKKGLEKKEVEREEQNQQHSTDIIEDPDNAPTRILLYECYHATVAIVRQFYRPDADSSEREIAARRRLVAALAKLERVEVSEPAGKRHRRPSRDDWPVKRPRGDTPNS